jgi:hypothetical protein
MIASVIWTVDAAPFWMTSGLPVILIIS